MKRSNKTTFRKFVLVGAAAIPVSLCSSLQAATWYVDINNPTPGNGTSWPLSYKYLQDALTNGEIEAGDEVWVAQGVYFPDVWAANAPGGNDIQDIAFDIPLEVKVFGGFPTGGGDGTFEARIPALFDDTILSGDIEQDDTPSSPPTPADIVGDNSFHVVTIINEDDPFPDFFLTEVDGFMITAGNALHIGMGENATGGGGGAFIIDQDPPVFPDDPIREGPLFRNCIFQGNRADRVGGAIAAVDVGLEVRDCQILNNESDGGLIEGDPPNTATQDGGGIAGIAPMTVVNSTFINNICTGETTGVHEVFASGGGLHVSGFHPDNAIAVASCIFKSNEAQDDPADEGLHGVGGGAAHSSSPIFR